MNSWGFDALLKGLALESAVVLKVEESAGYSLLQSLQTPGLEPANFGSQVQLSKH